jgi:hypothetical protein
MTKVRSLNVEEMHEEAMLLLGKSWYMYSGEMSGGLGTSTTVLAIVVLVVGWL